MMSFYEALLAINLSSNLDYLFHEILISRSLDIILYCASYEGIFLIIFAVLSVLYISRYMQVPDIFTR